MHLLPLKKKLDLFRSRRTDLNSRRCANRAALRPQDKILTQNSKRKEFFLKNSETPISSVIPEIFSRESRSFKCLWTPDRAIQGQAKSGSQVTGVTNLRKPPSPLPSPIKLSKPSSRARRILPCVAIPSF